MTLYTKYRPQDWHEVAGQAHITTTLMNALERGEVAHALLFSGKHGTGKTTVARILAKALGAVGSDIVEIDAASNRGIDDARRLRDETFYAPIYGSVRVFILDEVHMLTTEANNALLKTLEEPPPNVYFILCTTNPQKLLPTILSRCQQHNFKSIPADVITERLERLCTRENLLYDNLALQLIAASAKGSMRDAESMLDLFSNYGEIRLDQVKEVLGLGELTLVRKMIDAMAEENVGRGLDVVSEVWGSGLALDNYCSQVVQYLHGLMLAQMSSPDPALFIDKSDLGRFTVNGLRYAIGVWNSASQNVHRCEIPQLELECCVIDCWNEHITTGGGDF